MEPPDIRAKGGFYFGKKKRRDRQGSGAPGDCPVLLVITPFRGLECYLPRLVEYII